MKNITVGFIGLGKLGLPVALSINSKGYKVVGYDINPSVKKYLRDRTIPYKEEGAPELLKTHTIKFKPLKDVIEASDIIFVPIQTPHDPKFEGITRLPEERVDFDYTFLKEGLKNIADVVAELKQPKIVAIISTVLPGTIEREIKPLLNEYVKLVYTPQFIAMGTTINDFLNPEFTLIGVDDEDAASTIQSFINTLHNKPVFRTNIRNAELIKVAYNTYISMKIAYINTFMEICFKMNCDVDVLSDALSMATNRIMSPKYLRGGMGDGGGCHPRDNIALSWLAQKQGLSYDFFGEMMKAREKQTEWLANIAVWSARQTGLPIVIMGESFKPETNIITGSPARLLKNILVESNIRVEQYDPFTNTQARPPVKPAVFVIGTKHELFKDFPYPQGSVVIDPHRYVVDQEGVAVNRIGGK